MKKNKTRTNLRCQRCGNEWQYKGKNFFYAPCSKCKTSVSIKKNLTQSHLVVGQPSHEIESINESNPLAIPRIETKHTGHELATSLESGIGYD